MRRFVALLIAAIFLLAVQPGAMAMPAATSHPMSNHVAQLMPQGTMACDQSMPMKKQDTQHKDMGCCAGMLNCFGMAVISTDNRAVLHLTAKGSPPWSVQEPGPSLALQPDNPPPIA
ncbi:MAG: hypothetical protein KGJ78_13310 [Alphaproteobacteria bacterium]|nr:hypothetical protein [Alphaproteobacteria bacterium]